MMINHKILWVSLCLCMGVCSSCRGCHGRSKPAEDTARKPAVQGPLGYDLGTPRKYIMSESLHEISGICVLRGNGDTLYAIEDERGRLYYFHLGDNRFPSYKFGKHGDYEDVTILNDAEFVVLRSDGSLFVFPLGLIRGGDNKAVQSYIHILPRGEYEGLFGDAGGRLIALCKNCPDDDQREEVSGYVLQYGTGPQHRLSITDHFKVRLPAEKLHSIHTKIKFHPSALARHPITGEWYILSSVNKVLVVLDDHWAVKGMYDLDPVLYKQPEGLAFDKRGNMYISNEGVQGNANVLYFPYKP
ncbi:MAG TPA: SdiA-regulated domain-containing protein [Puia sp.]|nr:SdiA-regulated domain-containing protein [Puia sp.]